MIIRWTDDLYSSISNVLAKIFVNVLLLVLYLVILCMVAFSLKASPRRDIVQTFLQHKLKIFEKTPSCAGCKVYQLIPKHVKNDDGKFPT